MNQEARCVAAAPEESPEYANVVADVCIVDGCDEYAKSELGVDVMAALIEGCFKHVTEIEHFVQVEPSELEDKVATVLVAKP